MDPLSQLRLNSVGSTWLKIWEKKSNVAAHEKQNAVFEFVYSQKQPLPTAARNQPLPMPDV